MICVSATAQKQLIIHDSSTGIFINHSASANETFLRLASLYNLSPAKITAFNSVSLSHNITSGETIKIPLTNLNFEQKAQKGTYEVLVPLFHSVTIGESLSAIARKYNNVNVDLLKEWNASTTDNPAAGTNVIVGHLRVKSALASYFTDAAATTEPLVNKPTEPAPIKTVEPTAKLTEPAIKNAEPETRKTEDPAPKKSEQPIAKKTESVTKEAEQAIKKPEEPATKKLEQPTTKKTEPVTKKAEQATSKADAPIQKTEEALTTQEASPASSAIISNYNSDELFSEARKAAFDNKNYPLAVEYLKTGIAKSPDYSDLRIFLGRIYTWTDKVDSAREQFDYVIKQDPENRDAYVAYADLEYWNDRPEVALELVNQGLKSNADSKELLFRKAKFLNNLKKPEEALRILEQLLKIDAKNTEARALAAKIRGSASIKEIGVSYDYVWFDKQFSDPWHLVSLDYSHPTKLGSVAFRVNYANRFKSSGVQYEVESYPHIANGVYSYVSIAYSDDVGVFPKYRGGFSLYASLPKSFEGEVGFRYLQFSDATWIYTGALGKYYRSWLFTARAYVTPGESAISHSYNLTARYYYGGADDFFGATIGRGISPDETQANLLLNTTYRLVSQKAGATFRHAFKDKHVITLDAAWNNTEFRPETKGNQITAGIAYIIRL